MYAYKAIAAAVYTSPDTQPVHISIQPHQQNTGLSVTQPLELLVMVAL